MKTNIIVFLITQLLIVVCTWFVYDGLSLLGYINVSFFVSMILFFIGGIVFIIRTGFFDFFTESMRKVFSRKEHRKEIDSMRSPSEAMSVRPNWFFAAGLPSFLLMLGALVIYYM